jgi:transcriptional regulator with XRE-family HTH domain
MPIMRGISRSRVGRGGSFPQLTELIQTERLRQKLSLNEVATRSGLSHTMVMRVEKRERLPTIDTLLRIAEALGIDLSAVLKKAMKKVIGDK